MRIVCPHCNAAYEVAPELVSGRQTARCAKCQQTWSLSRPRDEDPEPLPSLPFKPIAADTEPTVIVTPPAREYGVNGADTATSRSLALRLSWAASILVLIAALGSAVALRGEVMHAWPPSTRVYAALGLAP